MLSEFFVLQSAFIVDIAFRRLLIPLFKTRLLVQLKQVSRHGMRAREPPRGISTPRVNSLDRLTRDLGGQWPIVDWAPVVQG